MNTLPPTGLVLVMSSDKALQAALARLRFKLEAKDLHLVSMVNDTAENWTKSVQKVALAFGLTSAQVQAQAQALAEALAEAEKQAQAEAEKQLAYTITRRILPDPVNVHDLHHHLGELAQKHLHGEASRLKPFESLRLAESRKRRNARVRNTRLKQHNFRRSLKSGRNR